MAKSRDSQVTEMEQTGSSAIVRAFISIAVLIGLYLLIRKLSGVLLPFLISLLIAYILNPIVGFFQYKCKFKNRLLSVLVTLLIVLGVIGGGIAMVVPPMAKQVQSVSKSIQEFAANFDISEYVSESTNQKIQEAIEGFDLYSLAQTEEFRKTLENVLPTVGNWLSTGLSALGDLMVVFICVMYVIFLLIDFDKFQENWLTYIPRKWRKQARILGEDLDKNMNAYFRNQALIACIVGILFAIGFQLIGLPMGIAMGLIIGVLNLVPYMQALGIPPCILLALIQASETGRPAWLCLLLVAVVFIIVQAIQDMLLTPKIMGEAMGLKPAIILLALSIWGALLGVIGMIIALPVTTLMIAYYKRYIAQ